MVSNFNKKSNSEFPIKRFWFQAGGIFFIIMVAILIVADIKIYQKKKDLALQINNYKQQIEAIQKNSQTLKDEIANSDNKDYLEKVAYEQGMVKTGEREVIFLAQEKKEKQAEASNNFQQNFMGWLSGIWQWIKNIF